jgi:glucokinase
MDASSMSELHEFLVTDALRDAGQMTRSEVAARVGLSLPSVSRIVRRLIELGVIEEMPGTAGDVGRTPGALRYVGRSGAVIAIDLGGTKCHGALASLAGELLEEHVRPTRSLTGAADVLVECIGLLRAEAAKRKLAVRATVVGIPALLDADTGLATAGPNVQWEGFDIVSRLKPVVQEPFAVENDVNLAAVGQAWRGEGREVSSFVTLSLGTGVGGGLVVDGRLVTGRHNAAGEIGYLVVPPPPGRSDPVNLESVASGPGILARAEELLAAGAESTLRADGLRTEEIFEAALSGDALGSKVVEETLDHVATAVVAIAAIVDPQRVILEGSVGRAIGPHLQALRERVAEKVLAAPEIVVSSLGPNGTVIGAVARALALVREEDAPEALRLGDRGFPLSGMHEEEKRCS